MTWPTFKGHSITGLVCIARAVARSILAADAQLVVRNGGLRGRPSVPALSPRGYGVPR